MIMLRNPQFERLIQNVLEYCNVCTTVHYCSVVRCYEVTKLRCSDAQS